MRLIIKFIHIYSFNYSIITFKLVELKNGETYNGHLANCDAWMNIYLTQVICTSRVIDVFCELIFFFNISKFKKKDGDRFWKMPECYIRGSTIKYLRIPDEVVDNYKEDSSNRGQMGNRRGDNSFRGRGGSSQGRGGGQSGRGGSANRGGFNNNRRNNTGSNQNLAGMPPAAKQARR